MLNLPTKHKSCSEMLMIQFTCLHTKWANMKYIYKSKHKPTACKQTVNRCVVHSSCSITATKKATQQHHTLHAWNILTILCLLRQWRTLSYTTSQLFLRTTCFSIALVWQHSKFCVLLLNCARKTSIFQNKIKITRALSPLLNSVVSVKQS